MKNRNVTDETEVLNLVNRGRWYIRNAIIPAIQLKKYRSIKQRYTTETDEDQPKRPPPSATSPPPSSTGQS